MASIEPTQKDPIARLWLARALRRLMQLAARTPRGRSGFWMDDEHCDELGLKHYEVLRFDARLAKLERIIKKLERKDLERTAPVFRIARLLGGFLELSVVEREVLSFAMLAASEPSFADAFDMHTSSLARFARIAGPAIGVSAESFTRALEARGTLARCCLVTTAELRYDDQLAVHPGLKALIREPPRDEAEAVRAFVTVNAPVTLCRADVEHLEKDVATAVALVKGALAHGTTGVNVLLYGPPGTGKTETARLIARAADADVGEVPVAGRDQEKLGRARLGTYVFCQRLMARSRRGVVLFDELEDVMPRSAMSAIYGVAESRDDKGLMVRTLEENAVPALWTTNHVDHIDPALLRRFDLVIEMKVPPERVRARIVDRHLVPLGIDEVARRALAADERLAPAVVARAARVASIAGALDAATIARIVDGSLKIVAGPKRVPFAAMPFPYDPAFANASIDLDVLTPIVAHGRGVRACLFGPPGTGKTAFVRHAAEQAGKRLLVKRMSDLLSCWVGETEKAIAAMFDEARDEDAVLFLDEADGLLRSRAAAERSWELTQTNELLVQMEAFDGVFMAATNLVDVLDAAAFRRFDMKVRFDPLTRDQRRALLRVVAPDVDEASARRIDRLDGLCAGHFSTVARRTALTGGDAVAALEDEHRYVKGAVRVGFIA